MKLSVLAVVMSMKKSFADTDFLYSCWNRAWVIFSPAVRNLHCQTSAPVGEPSGACRPTKKSPAEAPGAFMMQSLHALTSTTFPSQHSTSHFDVLARVVFFPSVHPTADFGSSWVCLDVCWNELTIGWLWAHLREFWTWWPGYERNGIRNSAKFASQVRDHHSRVYRCLRNPRRANHV